MTLAALRLHLRPNPIRCRKNEKARSSRALSLLFLADQPPRAEVIQHEVFSSVRAAASCSDPSVSIRVNPWLNFSPLPPHPALARRIPRHNRIHRNIPRDHRSCRQNRFIPDLNPRPAKKPSPLHIKLPPQWLQRLQGLAAHNVARFQTTARENRSIQIPISGRQSARSAASNARKYCSRSLSLSGARPTRGRSMRRRISIKNKRTVRPLKSRKGWMDRNRPSANARNSSVRSPVEVEASSHRADRSLP